MKRIKNDKVCKWCKKELLHGHPGLFCNFCTNQKKAKVATVIARHEATRAKMVNEEAKK